MLFFDFLYYLIYKFYSDYKEKGAEFIAAAIVGGFQALNVLTIIFLTQLFQRERSSINILVVIILFVIFQLSTYIRYIYRENPSVNAIESKWFDKTKLSRNKMKMFVLLYGAISIIGSFGLAIYNSKRS